MKITNTLRKAAGLFVELPEHSEPEASPTAMPEAAPVVRKSVEQIVRDTPGPNLDDIKPTVAEEKPQEPVLGADGSVNFAAIYRMANLPSEPFTAENVIDLLASLPAELPVPAKRATLKVTLEAMARTSNASTESVVADASRKLTALESYATSYQKQADDFATAATAEIDRLKLQILQRETSIEDAKKRADSIMSACEAESDRLDDVLEFFSLDAPPSKYATPSS